MSLPLKDYSSEGVAIIDEIVRCVEPLVVDATTYYVGRLAYTCNASIEGASSPDYGVWTGAGKTGSRKTVLLAGYPADATEVAIDLVEGLVLSTTMNEVLYVRYLAHEPIKHNVNNIAIAFPWLAPAGEATTFATLTFPFFAKFGYVSIAMDGAPSSDATLTLSNGTESANVTLPAAGGPVAAELDAPLKVDLGRTLTLSTPDGKDAFGLVILLQDV